MDSTDLCLGIIDEEFLSTQDYQSKRKIDGVKIVQLRRFKDDGGSFMEIARFADGSLLDNGTPTPFSIAQINHSYISPGVIKAWHIHFKQEDVWFVPPRDKLLVGLFDTRKDSPTCGTEMRVVLGDGDGQILLIPRGVAHGCANVYEREMQLMYLVNQHFSAIDPDEHRLPWDALVGKSFWEIQKG